MKTKTENAYFETLLKKLNNTLSENFTKIKSVKLNIFIELDCEDKDDEYFVRRYCEFLYLKSDNGEYLLIIKRSENFDFSNYLKKIYPDALILINKSDEIYNLIKQSKIFKNAEVINVVKEC